MSTAPAQTAPHPTKEPAQTSPLRVGILVGVLLLVVALFGYDYKFAKPATEAADKAVEKLSTDRNAKGVSKDGKIDPDLVKPADVHDLLKMKPSTVKTEKDHLIEYYWFGGMPHRNYISVLYYGSGDNLRYNTHYLNTAPDPEDLPNAKLPEGPPTVSNDAPATTGDGKKGPPMSETPSTDKPSTDKPEAPSTDKPEAPATDKPAADKPATDKPAEDKPADK